MSETLNLESRGLKEIEKQAKKDANKAAREWYKLRNVGIDVILKSFGYCKADCSMYKFRKIVWNWVGMDYNKSERYEVILDTYNLIHGNNGKIEVSIELK